MKKMIIVAVLTTIGYSRSQSSDKINFININQSNNKQMENDAKQVVTAFLTAVQQGNNEMIDSLLNDKIMWIQPGNNRVSGLKNSKSEVFQMVGKMFELSDNTLKLTEIKSISVNGNRVACLLHWNGVQPPGGILDVDNIDVYTVENGQIIEADIFSANLAAEDKFWGK
jgi:ketosteroid isomerase-like protein